MFFTTTVRLGLTSLKRGSVAVGGPSKRRRHDDVHSSPNISGYSYPLKHKLILLIPSIADPLVVCSLM